MNRVIVPARQASKAGGINSLESIPGVHKRLKIRALQEAEALMTQYGETWSLDSPLRMIYRLAQPERRDRVPEFLSLRLNWLLLPLSPQASVCPFPLAS
jgi:hypothetical protein